MTVGDSDDLHASKSCFWHALNFDSDTRREQYHEMQILRDDGGVLLPMFANNVQAVNNRISSPETVGSLADGQRTYGRTLVRR
jgi:hypothetical protein